MGYVDVQSLSHVLPDGRVLFDEVSFRVGDGTRTALVGRQRHRQDDPAAA